MSDGVKTTFNSSQYGRYFEAIPIAECEVISFSSSTQYTAPEDVVLYKVMIGDELNGDTGVYVDGKLISYITAGAFYLSKGQTINLIGDFIVIK